MFSLSKTIAIALEVNVEDITNDTQSEDIESWDSLGQLSIVSSLATVSNGTTDTVYLADCTSVQQISKALKNAGIEFED